MKGDLSGYADDNKAYIRLKEELDWLVMQSIINNIDIWSDVWQLTLNGDKTFLLKVGRFQDLIYYLENKPIVPVTKTLDLGITVQSDLKFHSHCLELKRRANYALRCINLSFTGHSSQFLINLYTMYVRPILENNSVVFSPHFIQDINNIESVQKRFTKYLPGMYDLAYNDRLVALNLDSLEVRRFKSDLVLTFKICNNMSHLKFGDFFEYCTTSTRGHTFKLKKHYTRTDVFKYFFCNRVVDSWNDLSQECVSSPSVNVFKNNINKIDFSRLCRGTAVNE